ncbi:hypothetical protein HYPSUDRAFT_1052040 [Hypholoma sublateritium FD-334 SS-4]|uniref:Uncharacterized protein n=1 Tax=Hypholoma sublateritium (strain FD-334 SS-4) TaxID=945553 RepID=A0A0D2NJW2_HYPSF|nr:hypothetical protein HYPSUDRAFT_1052040 [Hypholoma sublateritium FD-334 SS-4]
MISITRPTTLSDHGHHLAFTAQCNTRNLIESGDFPGIMQPTPRDRCANYLPNNGLSCSQLVPDEPGNRSFISAETLLIWFFLNQKAVRKIMPMLWLPEIFLPFLDYVVTHTTSIYSTSRSIRTTSNDEASFEYRRLISVATDLMTCPLCLSDLFAHVLISTQAFLLSKLSGPVGTTGCKCHLCFPGFHLNALCSRKTELPRTMYLTAGSRRMIYSSR